MTSSDEYDITSNSSTTSNGGGGLHVTSLNIGVGGVICSPSASVTSDYHSSTASTASTLYNSFPPKTTPLAKSTASLATVYKSPHPPPVPPKPRQSRQQSVIKSNLSAQSVSANSRQLEVEEHQESVVTREDDREEEDRLSVTEGDVREARLRRIDCGVRSCWTALHNICNVLNLSQSTIPLHNILINVLYGIWPTGTPRSTIA